MNEFDLKARPILVIGAGIMGAGIAQVAAQAGHNVCLFDMRADAATAAKDTLAKGLSSLVAKGKLTEAAVAQTLDSITAISSSELTRGMKIWPDCASDVWRISNRGNRPS